MRKSIINNSFVKSFSLLAGGSIIGQVVTFAVSPILTRLYSTEDFGLFTFILSMTTIFGGVINGRYDISIVSSNRNEVKPLIQLSTIICIVFSAIATLICYLYVYLMSEVGFGVLNYIYIYVLLITVGIINILNSFNNRFSYFKLISKVYVIRSIAQNGLMVILGFLNLKHIGLLLSQLFGQLLGLKAQSDKMDIKGMLTCSKLAFLRILNVSRIYKSQLIFSTPSTFINALTYSLISVFVGSLFGLSTLGIYSISFRILGLPLGIFSSNLAKVHFSTANIELNSKQNFFRSTIKTCALSFFIITPISVILLFFIPEIIVFLYGEAWRDAGLFIQILTPMFALRFIVGSIGFSFIIKNKQHYELFYQLGLLLSLLVIMVITHIYNITEIQFFTLISSVYSIIYIFEISNMIKISK